MLPPDHLHTVKKTLSRGQESVQRDMTIPEQIALSVIFYLDGFCLLQSMIAIYEKLTSMKL